MISKGAQVCHVPAWLRAAKLSAVASRLGTPVYVYDADDILKRFTLLHSAMVESVSRRAEIIYAIKANSNERLVRVLLEAGASFEVSNIHELQFCLGIGVDQKRIHYSNAICGGGTPDGVEDVRVSTPRLEQLKDLLRSGRPNVGARVAVARGLSDFPSLRMPGGGKHTKGFGVPADALIRLGESRLFREGLSFLHQHVGSKWSQRWLPSYFRTCSAMSDLASSLARAGCFVRSVNFGGGMDPPACLKEYEVFCRRLAQGIAQAEKKLPVTVQSVALEPGRFLVGQSGVLLLTVLSVEPEGEGTFGVFVDGGYYLASEKARYGISYPVLSTSADRRRPVRCSVYGDVLEPMDVFATDISLPRPRPGDVLAICNVGAYAFSERALFHRRAEPQEYVLLP